MAPLRGGHPAEVLRVIDGDTFEARVRIWPGMDVTTRVRLRGIDAAELHARCDDERVKALAAREALTRILAEGTIGVSDVGQDKYRRPRRCRRLHGEDARRLGGDVPQRVGPRLFRRPARELVRLEHHRSTKTSAPTGHAR